MVRQSYNSGLLVSTFEGSKPNLKNRRAAPQLLLIVQLILGIRDSTPPGIRTSIEFFNKTFGLCGTVF
jgi:hypothetical protein